MKTIDLSHVGWDLLNMERMRNYLALKTEESLRTEDFPCASVFIFLGVVSGVSFGNGVPKSSMVRISQSKVVLDTKIIRNEDFGRAKPRGFYITKCGVSNP